MAEACRCLCTPRPWCLTSGDLLHHGSWALLEQEECSLKLTHSVPPTVGLAMGIHVPEVVTGCHVLSNSASISVFLSITHRKMSSMVQLQYLSSQIHPSDPRLVSCRSAVACGCSFWTVPAACIGVGFLGHGRRCWVEEALHTVPENLRHVGVVELWMVTLCLPNDAISSLCTNAHPPEMPLTMLILQWQHTSAQLYLRRII